ncbi:MAG: hypothetical protein KC418_08970 [Anaerolineales bacterium]|nr:hypothetical protein [Anaerolineales bacterium]MCB8954242.1 hypothetical protein [Ardenticatenales bacterium]
MYTNGSVSARMPAWVSSVVTANGIFCAGSGLVLLVASRPLAQFLGPVEAVMPAFPLLGIILFLYGSLLVWLARTGRINRHLVAVMAELDIAWVLGSYGLLFWGGLAWTNAGKWTIILIAEIVFTFALAQAIAWWKGR